MKPYDQEFRSEVLAACDANEGTKAVALSFGVSESWVRRIKQQRRETGQVALRRGVTGAAARRAPGEKHAGQRMGDGVRAGLDRRLER